MAESKKSTFVENSGFFLALVGLVLLVVITGRGYIRQQQRLAKQTDPAYRMEQRKQTYTKYGRDNNVVKLPNVAGANQR